MLWSVGVGGGWPSLARLSMASGSAPGVGGRRVVGAGRGLAGERELGLGDDLEAGVAWMALPPMVALTRTPQNPAVSKRTFGGVDADAFGGPGLLGTGLGGQVELLAGDGEERPRVVSNFGAAGRAAGAGAEVEELEVDAAEADDLAGAVAGEGGEEALVLVGDELVAGDLGDERIVLAGADRLAALGRSWWCCRCRWRRVVVAAAAGGEDERGQDGQDEEAAAGVGGGATAAERASRSGAVSRVTAQVAGAVPPVMLDAPRRPDGRGRRGVGGPVGLDPLDGFEEAGGGGPVLRLDGVDEGVEAEVDVVECLLGLASPSAAAENWAAAQTPVWIWPKRPVAGRRRSSSSPLPPQAAVAAASGRHEGVARAAGSEGRRSAPGKAVTPPAQNGNVPRPPLVLRTSSPLVAALLVLGSVRRRRGIQRQRRTP